MSGGTLLATGVFTNETSSGWQTLIFSSPVAISVKHHLCGVVSHERPYVAAAFRLFSTAWC